MNSCAANWHEIIALNVTLLYDYYKYYFESTYVKKCMMHSYTFGCVAERYARSINLMSKNESQKAQVHFLEKVYFKSQLLVHEYWKKTRPILRSSIVSF